MTVIRQNYVIQLTENIHGSTSTTVIVISKKLFCLILVGLASLAIASLCAIFRLPMHQAVILFLATWLLLITIFEAGTFSHSDNLREPPNQK